MDFQSSSLIPRTVRRNSSHSKLLSYRGSCIIAFNMNARKFFRQIFPRGKTSRLQSAPAVTGKHSTVYPTNHVRNLPLRRLRGTSWCARKPVSTSFANSVVLGPSLPTGENSEHESTANTTTAVSTTTSPPNPRTFRLSLIPTSINENYLQEYLKGLRCEPGIPTENDVLAYSLTPYID